MSVSRRSRAGPPNDILKGPVSRAEDPRQKSFDLGEGQQTSEERIYGLSYRLASLRANISIDPWAAWADRPKKSDRVSVLASGFARELEQVEPVHTASEEEAAAVNRRIAMVAEEADALIEALITDAESQGLAATGAWLKIPLVECQAFEVPEIDPEEQKADDLRDQWRNNRG